MLIELDDVRLNVIDEGAGPAVLFLHGLGANHRIWSDQLDALRGAFRCVAPDLRGSGLSERPVGPYSLELFADDVASACARIGVESAVVVGQSMGGMVAQALAVRHPERVDALVLVGTALDGRRGAGPAPALKSLEDVIRRDGLGGIPDLVRDAIYPKRFQESHPEKVWHFERELLSFDVDALIAALNRSSAIDFTAALPRLRLPTLIVVGAHDRICPPEESEHLKQLMPDAELIVLEHCGHQPFYEDPERFNTLLREFVSDHTTTPSTMAGVK